MSRIGKQPVAMPGGVDVTVKGPRVVVKGPKGSLEQTFPEEVRISVEDDKIVVTRINDERRSRAMHGLSRALLANMVTGVVDGYTKQLELHGVGYRAALRGSTIELSVGFSHTVKIDAPDGVDFEVPDPTKIIVSGIDKQQVGQVSANIRKVRPPEPYKGKGIRYVGERIVRKAGKAGVAAGG